MPACTACHDAKVACDKQQPCSRCLERNLVCIPRVSRQGQGPKKRRKKELAKQQNPDGLVASSEDATLVKHDFGGQHHYGVRYLIYSWTSFALSRRSFSLLSRASRLAASSNISMDEILNEKRRSFLEPLVWNTTESTMQNSQALQWSDLPPRLRRVCGVSSTTSTVFQSRYLFVREANRGHSRYLVTDAFANEICTAYALQQTWNANDKPVTQLFLQQEADFDKFTSAINYQMMRYTEPNKAPENLRVKKVNVVFGQHGSNQQDAAIAKEMDMIYTFEIVDLEQSFYVCEFLPSHLAAPTAAHCSDKAQVSHSDSLEGIASSEPLDPLPLDGVEDLFMDDNDLTAFLEYIK